MEFLPIKTRPILPPKDCIFDIFDTYISDLKNWDVLFITSKIVAIHQWRCIKNWEISKKELIKKESENIVLSDVVPWKDIYLTVKNKTLIPSAGIDESNGNWYLILWPNELEKITKEIHNYLCKKYNIKQLWVILTDSTTRPLRKGVTWISIYSYGIKTLQDKRGTKDVFWSNLEFTQINVVDAITSMAVYIMGEWAECTPILIWREIPWVKFGNYSYEDIPIDIKDDLYKPLMDCFNI